MKRLWNGLSIRSKLTFMLLLTSLIGAGAIIAIGFVTGQEAMSEQVRERLTAIRSAKAFEIEQYLSNVAAEVEIQAGSRGTRETLVTFADAYASLADVDTIDCGRVLSDFYEDYLDRLDERLDVRQDVSTFYPRSQAGCYLQTNYIVRNPSASGRRDALDVAPRDRSAYANVHETFHPDLRDFMRAFGFYDVFLVDATGNVVYSAAKEADFATNLRYGPYRTSGLARLFEDVRDNADLAEAQFVDFSNYRPSYGMPAAFAGAPVVRDGAFLGMLAIQLPVDRINEIMNYGGEWAANGLGRTGETVLVGADKKLRSLSRGFLADSAGFVNAMSQQMPRPRYEALLRRGPLLTVEANSPNVEAAARGQTGITSVLGYRGETVLSAYAPLNLPDGLAWVITAEMDQGEAFAAVSEFGRRMLIGLCAIVILTVLLALLFTRVFMGPIERLTAGAERVRAGDTTTQVPVATGDEIGHLTEVFNGMVAGIEGQKAEIAKQATANEDLLTAKFPPAVAERYRAGEANIVEPFENVTVLFADLRRTEQLAELDPQRGLHILNTIVRAFNEEAEKLGMEIIRPVADGYLAVCDMNSPRLDNTRRALDMGLAMRETMARVNEQFGLGLTIAVGIDHGPVSAGIIAESTNAYDVWGRAVDVVQRIAAIPDDNIVGVGPTVVELVGDRYTYTEGPRLLMSTGENIPVAFLTGRREGVSSGADEGASSRQRSQRTAVRAED